MKGIEYKCAGCGLAKNSPVWSWAGLIKCGWKEINSKRLCPNCATKLSEICDGERTCIHCSLCMDCYGKHDCPENGEHEERRPFTDFKCTRCGDMGGNASAEPWRAMYNLGWRKWRGQWQTTGQNWMGSTTKKVTVCLKCNGELTAMFT